MPLAGGYGCQRLERKSQSERPGLQKMVTCEKGQPRCECQDVNGRRDRPGLFSLSVLESWPQKLWARRICSGQPTLLVYWRWTPTTRLHRKASVFLSIHRPSGVGFQRKGGVLRPDMNGNNSVSTKLSVSQVREQERSTVDCQHGVCSEAEEPNPSLRAASVGFDRRPFRTRRGYL